LFPPIFWQRQLGNSSAGWEFRANVHKIIQETNQKLGELWRAAGADEKAPFEEQAAQEKARLASLQIE